MRRLQAGCYAPPMAEPESVEDAAEAVVDARGFHCPIPLLRLKRGLRAASPGRRVVLLATDPAAPLDVAAFCNIEGHAYLGHRETAEGTMEIAVRVRRPRPFPGATPVL
jgi:TusA-related sulfurtransferase